MIRVDAFARVAGEGNPAAVAIVEAWPDDARMQAIARDVGLPATVFAVSAGEGAWDLRWFSPKAEMALCGHGTLAAAHVLMAEAQSIRFRTRRAGVLTVEREKAGYALSLPAFAPVPTPLLEAVVAMGGTPAATLWHDGGYAVLVYRDEDEVRALAPDFGALAALGDTLFIATAQGRTAEVVSRAFVPGAGMDEDPATGSAHAVIAPYWAGVLGRNGFTAFQASARGGWLACRVEGERVVLTGTCVTVANG